MENLKFSIVAVVAILSIVTAFTGCDLEKEEETKTDPLESIKGTYVHYYNEPIYYIIYDTYGEFIDGWLERTYFRAYTFDGSTKATLQAGYFDTLDGTHLVNYVGTVTENFTYDGDKLIFDNNTDGTFSPDNNTFTFLLSSEYERITVPLEPMQVRDTACTDLTGIYLVYGYGLDYTENYITFNGTSKYLYCHFPYEQGLRFFHEGNPDGLPGDHGESILIPEFSYNDKPCYFNSDFSCLYTIYGELILKIPESKYK